MEGRRQRIRTLEEVSPNVYRRPKGAKGAFAIELLPPLDQKDHPRSLTIKRAERLVGKRLRREPDS